MSDYGVVTVDSLANSAAAERMRWWSCLQLLAGALLLHLVLFLHCIRLLGLCASAALWALTGSAFLWPCDGTRAVEDTFAAASFVFCPAPEGTCVCRIVSSRACRAAPTSHFFFTAFSFLFTNQMV